MIDNFASPFDGIIEAATDDCPIKPGDKLYVSDGMNDVEGEAMWCIRYPFDEVLAIREADGTELKVNGWQCDIIEINGEEYAG